MISTEQINLELDLSKKIYLYYFDKMADYISIGSDSYIQWYKDLNNIYFILGCLKSISVVDDKIYCSNVEVDVNFFHQATSRIREYLNFELRETVYRELDSLGNIKDIITPGSCPPTIVTYNNFYQDWRHIIIDVLYDDTSTLIMPFNISEIDQDATRVTVNDNDPIHLVQPDEEGCHIVGSTLYWHTYYNLKAGDRVFIQYLINITQ